MNKTATTLWIGFLAMIVSPLFCSADEPKKKILFFSQSFGFRHPVVTRPLTGELSTAEKLFKDFAEKARYQVFFSQDYHDLESDEQFERFDAIVFYTSGSPKISRDAFLKWLRSGKAYIGIHCATDSFYEWEEYAKMIGAQFQTHGPSDKDVTIKVEDKEHQATDMLGDEWIIADEIYQFKEDKKVAFDREKMHVLLSLDNKKTDLEKQRMSADKYYPIAWTNTEGKGRVFYTSLGHSEEVWVNPKFQNHLLGGIGWALGEPLKKPDYK